MQEQYFKKLNQYLLQNVIGHGAFGVVYKSWDSNLKREVAIKEINLQKAQIQEMTDKEVEICKKLKHKNIVELYDCFKKDQYVYMVFEYCGNGDLKKLFQNNKFSEQDIRAIFQQIVAGIKYLHTQKICHRDLKLDNIYINSEYQIKIGDFGFARQFNGLMQSYLGTPLFMAPEIINQSGEYDELCDIWSLGMNLYNMIYGTTYIQKFITPKATLHDLKALIQKTELYFFPKPIISKDLQNILTQMLCVDPKKRMTYGKLFNHPWVLQNEQLSGQISSQTISGRISSDSCDKLDDLEQTSIQDQLSYQFGQDYLLKEQIIETLRDIINSCSEINEIKSYCEKFFKKMRATQNNYKIHLIIQDQSQIVEEGKFKIFDFKYQIVYLLIKICYQLHEKNGFTKYRLQKIQNLIKLLPKINFSNYIHLRINKDYTDLSSNELNLQFEQIIDEVKELIIQQQARNSQRPAQKDYEIIFENKQLDDDTLNFLNNLIERQELLFIFDIR